MAQTQIKGDHFRAELDPKHPYLWKVYDKQGRRMESFGGSEDAARSHVAALDRVRNKEAVQETVP